MPKLYLENRRSLDIIDYAFRLNSKYWNIEQVKEELTVSLAEVRAYQTSSRNGAFDYLNALPCGYQDAQAEKVEQVYAKFQALKIAYRLKQGDLTLLNKFVNRAAGNI